MTANLLRRHGVDSLFRDNTKYIRLMYYKLHLMYRNAVTSPRCPAACGPSNLSPEFSHSFLPPQTRAANGVSRSFTVIKKVLTRAFSLLKVPSSVFTLKKVLRHYAKPACKHSK